MQGGEAGPYGWVRRVVIVGQGDELLGRNRLSALELHVPRDRVRALEPYRDRLSTETGRDRVRTLKTHA